MAEEKKTRKRDRLSQDDVENLLLKIQSGRLDTLQEKVAWVMNHYPPTRSSDVELQLKFWETFEGDIYSSLITPEQYIKMTRLTSIARARAKIQNEFHLFLASEEVRRFRGTLSEEEKERAVAQKADYPAYIVYGDESGKTERFLVVGSLWVLHGFGAHKFNQAFSDWKAEHGFKGEFHFNKLTTGYMDKYVEFTDFIKRHSEIMSFKALSIERHGITNVQNAYSDMYYHLLIAGIDHEQATGRAPLPRKLVFYKDKEEIGADKIFVANLRDRLKTTAKIQYEDQLLITELGVADSKDNIFVQIADLFTASINRIINKDRAEMNHKDEFASYFLKQFAVQIDDTKMIHGDNDIAFNMFM